MCENKLNIVWKWTNMSYMLEMTFWKVELDHVIGLVSLSVDTYLEDSLGLSPNMRPTQFCYIPTN